MGARIIAIALPMLLAPVAAAAPDDSVRIYRCVSSNGAVTLADTPCGQGREEIREMQRPRDPPTRAVSTQAPVPTEPPTPAPAREVRYVHVQPPQPMYACTAADGTRYVSESNEGNPRWEPLWVNAWVAPPVWRGGGSGPRPGHGGGPRPPRPPAGSGHGPRPPLAAIGVPGGSVLVRDTCRPLPQQEVCSRLQDRRWELDRRYNSALQSEREAITREQRGIDARLRQDCGSR